MMIATTLFLLSLAGSSAPAQTQARAVDPRWTPWMGCWELIDENVRDQELDPAQLADGVARRRSRSTGAQVCVNPAGQGDGVTLSTIVGSQPALVETVIADGADYPIVEADCKGTQRTEWSRSGQRLFAKADLACKGQDARVVSGLALIADGPTWVDIQVIESQGTTSVRVRRYRRSLDQTHARAVAPPASTAQALRVPSPFSLDDVKEASAKLPVETVEAALIELNTNLMIDKKRLLDLDQAGVPDSVIDLMIAIAYPKRFEIQRSSSSSSGGYGGMGLGGYGGYGGYGLAWPFGLFDLDYGPAYYSPYGYSYWGQYDPRYYQYSGFVPVEPGGGGKGGNGNSRGDIAPSGNGRIVDGRGYTRVTTRAPEPTSTRHNNGDGTWSTSAAGGSSNSGGSSGVSSSGYSGGGGGGASSGGGGGERTAQPRPPGGDR